MDIGQPGQTAPKKVLIVEDEKMLGDALEMKFKHEGFAVLRAENGQVGLDVTSAEKPDCIILDLLMPVMDGKTMLKKLRQMPEFKQLPVIVLTNAGDVDSIREMKTYYDANEFLIKSNISPEDVAKAVRDLI